MLNKQIRRFLENIENEPTDILIASHQYGLLVVPQSNRFSLKEAVLEISKNTQLRVACDPPIESSTFVDINDSPDIVIQWGIGEDDYHTVDDATQVISHVSVEEFLEDPKMNLFSGMLTSPWTLFRVPSQMGNPHAPSARKTLLDMSRNVTALHNSDSQVLRQRLRSVEISVRTWQTIPVPKHPSGFRLGLFPVETGVDRTQTLLGPESVHVITKPDEADLITRLVLQKCRHGKDGSDVCITDATANVGGNTLSFSRAFGKVQSVELDQVNYKALCHNVNLYKRKNVECILGDYVDVLPKLTQDIVFIDPPWGGTGYRMHRHISLSLSKRPLSEIISRLSDKANDIVIKVPLNFDLAAFLYSESLQPLIDNGMLRVEALTMKSFMVVFVFYLTSSFLN